MSMFLTLVSGIAWMVVYEECIRLGLRDKTYAMPFFALALNLTWEAIYCVGEVMFNWHGDLTGLTLVQTLVNGFWVCLDFVILYTYVKFGRKEWPAAAGERSFVPWTVLGLVCSFVVQIVFIVEFGGVAAAQYSAFIQNLIMSILFIDMLWRRGSLAGQSLTLAVAKWLGTLAPTILMGIITFDALVLVCGIFCSVFDLIYIWLVVRMRRAQA